jgi:hypothetical protein
MKKLDSAPKQFLVLAGVVLLLIVLVLPFLDYSGYEYRERKIAETVYELPVRSSVYWDEAVAEFSRRHTDLEIQSIVRPVRQDYGKKVVVFVRKKEQQ